MFNLLKLKNKKIIIILLLLITIFSIVSFFYYKRIILPRLNNKYIANKEFIPKDNDINSEFKPKHATLYYFYTTWCPHCKAANPHWQSLQTETNGNVKGINIIFKDVDCEQDTTTADKFKINSYPTIKLIYNNTIYDYDAKPDKNTLIQFLNSVL